MGADAGGSSLVNDAKYAIRKVVQTPLENVATVRMIDIHVRGAPGIGHRLRVRNMTVADTVMIMSIRQRHAAAVGVAARTHITAGERTAWEEIVEDRATMGGFVFGRGHRTNQMTRREARAGAEAPIIVPIIQNITASGVEVGALNILTESVHATVQPHIRSPAPLRLIHHVLRMV
jgi:hypothetical protein